MRSTASMILAAMASAVLAGCGGGTLDSVKAGPMSLGDKHRVVLSRQWADVSPVLPQRFKKVRVLSIDGPLLNRVYVARGLEKGEGLIRKESKIKPVPTFHPDMSPTELVEFTADSIAAMDYKRVQTSGLRPAMFGQSDGLRLDVTAQTITGLDVRGTAQMAVIKDRLYLILYLAPAEHYYAASLADVEAMLSSAS